MPLQAAIQWQCYFQRVSYFHKKSHLLKNCKFDVFFFLCVTIFSLSARLIFAVATADACMVGYVVRHSTPVYTSFLLRSLLFCSTEILFFSVADLRLGAGHAFRSVCINLCTFITKSHPCGNYCRCPPDAQACQHPLFLSIWSVMVRWRHDSRHRITGFFFYIFYFIGLLIFSLQHKGWICYHRCLWCQRFRPLGIQHVWWDFILSFLFL